MSSAAPRAKPTVICIGAGPAGLTAAYRLGKSNLPVTVFESHPAHVGGIARTESYKGFRFDIGGHRFFSKSAEIEALWTEILGDELLTRPRKTRILYRGKLFDYPLKPFDALAKLGPFEAGRCMVSYGRAKLAPYRPAANFEQWVVNQFGRRLFHIFFKTYTEKVWGMACTDISADWAAQRINRLSLGRAIWHGLLPKRWRGRHGDAGMKTLIDRFRYPRLGPGQLWERTAQLVERQGGAVRLGVSVERLRRDAASGDWIVETVDRAGKRETHRADHVISTAAIVDLAGYLDPPPPADVLRAARALRYRDFLIVALIVRERDAFDDIWLYIHEPGVKVGRIQNFKTWSPDLVPDPALNCYGMEYFCSRGDELWEADDAALIELARRELAELGLARPNDILDGYVVRQPKAYPVYDEAYVRNVATFREWSAAALPGLHLVGRNGMHKYNNQDHAMMTGLMAAENIVAGYPKWDLWRVNQDAAYHEAGEDRSLALETLVVPTHKTATS
ncbi:MAG: NAD(P)/FAD-dependent oxidoreductase [Alphaproteobacteria bacterium]